MFIIQVDVFGKFCLYEIYFCCIEMGIFTVSSKGTDIVRKRAKPRAQNKKMVCSGPQNG